MTIINQLAKFVKNSFKEADSIVHMYYVTMIVYYVRMCKIIMYIAKLSPGDYQLVLSVQY